MFDSYVTIYRRVYQVTVFDKEFIRTVLLDHHFFDDFARLGNDWAGCPLAVRKVWDELWLWNTSCLRTNRILKNWMIKHYVSLDMHTHVCIYIYTIYTYVYTHIYIYTNPLQVPTLQNVWNKQGDLQHTMTTGGYCGGTMHIYIYIYILVCIHIYIL